MGSETTLHQIAPYIGRMKSTMARSLIEFCSRPGDVVLDPFMGSGVVPLESLMAGRGTISCDINPYAFVLTKAKLQAPSNVQRALALAEYYLGRAREDFQTVETSSTPRWVQEFFHPETLRETVALARVLKDNNEYFLLGCLLGILHHQRPGFLSYPASHAVPYLRNRKFPREEYPELYEYRAVRPRLLKKVARVYRRFPNVNRSLPRRCYLKDSAHLSLPNRSIDAVVTSPPYMNALDYIRDNRLRLWFLGFDNEKDLQKEVPKNAHRFEELMGDCFIMISRALRARKRCVMVVGEVNKSGGHLNTSNIVLDAAEELGSFDCEAIVEDAIPRDRRVRKEGSCTKREWIIVLKKRA